MPKRSLRVTKWLSNTPAGVCTTCSREFKVPMTALTKTKDAQVNLQQQFEQHECVAEPESGYWSCEYPDSCACGCRHVPGACEYCHYLTGKPQLARH